MGRVLRLGWNALSQFSTLQWFFTGGGGAVVFVLTLLAHMPIAVALFFGAAVFALIAIALYHKDARRILLAQARVRSPIVVHEGALAEEVYTEDESGIPIDGLNAVKLSLRATNERPDGATLRNVQARLHFLGGKSSVLRITNVQDGQHLKHGEIAHIEMGYVPIIPGQAMVPHGNGAAYQAHRGIDDQNARNGFRTLYVDDATAQLNRHGIGQGLSGEPFPNICVIITADDVAARVVWIDMDLKKEKAWEWLTVKPKPTPL